MLDIKLLRKNPEDAKKRLGIKNFKKTNLVDLVVLIDSERSPIKNEIDRVRKELNIIASQIESGIKEAKDNEKVLELKSKVQMWKNKLDLIETKMEAFDKKYDEAILQIPNLPSLEVPPGKSPEDNEIVRKGGIIPTLPSGSVPHWDLIEKYDIIDFKSAAKISGSSFPLYKGKGAKLQRALIQLFLDYNINAGYTEYLPPYLVNQASAYGTGQYPDKEGQMYHVALDDLYLIPTSEVPITNIYKDQILEESDMPIKMTAYSACFRREAGSFGKEVRGLNRVHQFDKVEIVQLVMPENSYDVLEQMVEHVENLLKSLELPYRVVKLCGGEMSFASALTYDFEVYSAAQEKWLEVSSVSNFETFQSNRMKIRYKDAAGKSQLIHTLNGSSLALPRIMACILENNQSEKGIEIPKALKSYTGFDIIS